jgi:hypothetical protein
VDDPVERMRAVLLIPGHFLSAISPAAKSSAIDETLYPDLPDLSINIAILADKGSGALDGNETPQ